MGMRPFEGQSAIKGIRLLRVPVGRKYACVSASNANKSSITNPLNGGIHERHRRTVGVKVNHIEFAGEVAIFARLLGAQNTVHVGTCILMIGANCFDDTVMLDIELNRLDSAG